MAFSFGRSIFILLSVGVMERSWKCSCYRNHLLSWNKQKISVDCWVKKKEIQLSKVPDLSERLCPSAFSSAWRRFFFHEKLVLHKKPDLPSSVRHIWLRPKLMFDFGYSVQTRRERHRVPKDSTNLVITTWLWHPLHSVAASVQSIWAKTFLSTFCWHGDGLFFIDNCAVQEQSAASKRQNPIYQISSCQVNLYLFEHQSLNNSFFMTNRGSVGFLALTGL